MKKLLLCTILFPISAWADDIVLNSKILEATVYSDQASVTRAASFQVPEGDHTLIIKGVSASLIQDSVRVQGSAQQSVVFGSIDILSQQRDSEQVTEQQHLQAEINQYQSVLDTLHAEASPYVLEDTFLYSLAQAKFPIAGESSVASNPNSWEKAIQVIFENKTRINNKLYEISQKEMAVKKSQDALKIRLAERGGTAAKTYDIAVHVHASAATAVDLNLTYQVGGAKWVSTYEARLNTGSREVNLTQAARVSQGTGEDWNDVKLVLSTARPSSSIKPTPLGKWIISEAQPFAANLMAPPSSPAPMAMIMDKANNAEVALRARSAPIAQEMPVSVTTDYGINVEYKVPTQSSIPSDGTVKQVLLGEQSLRAVLSAQIVPKSDLNAYLIARVKNTGTLPLLPGNTLIYLNDMFVGKAELAMVRSGEETDLAFGQDTAIKVSMDTTPMIRGEEGLINKNQTVSQNTMIKVKNYHDFPIQISVTDQIPASDNSHIRVETNFVPQPVYSTDQAGKVLWQSEYRSGEEQKIQENIRIIAPADTRIIGLSH